MKTVPMTIRSGLLLSDLHFELDTQNPPELSDLFPRRKADAVFLAGDIACGTNAMPLVDRLLSLGYEVFYVPGNHEFHGHCMESLVEEWRLLERESQGFHFLYRDVVQTHNLRILGCTLWASLDTAKENPVSSELRREPLDGIFRMKVREMEDFHSIRTLSDDGKERTLSPEKMVELFWEDQQWLSSSLSEKTNTASLVMTHYLPSVGSVDPRFEKSPINPIFYTELRGLMHRWQVRHWLHGHTHASCDYQEGPTSVLCNPRGYQDLHMVNSEFQWEKYIHFDA